MDLVWPWYAIDIPQDLVDSHGREVGQTPKLEIRAPRSDQDALLVLWTGPGQPNAAIGREWAKSVARLYQGNLVRETPIALGGALGYLAEVSAGGSTTWRIVMPRQDSTVTLEAGAPAAHAAAYWAQIESMLATWEWDD